VGKKYINDYINFHCTSVVIQRGKKLYKDKKIVFAGVNPIEDVANFEVQGGKNYKVRISGFVKENIVSSCTCPFDWGSACKHTVAVLLYLRDKDFSNKVNRFEIEKPHKSYSQRRASEPFLIADYQNLTEEYVLSNTRDSIIREMNMKDYTFKTLSITKDRMVYEVSDRYGWKVVEVEIYYVKGSVYSRTNKNVVVGMLSGEEAVLLRHFARSPVPNYLYLHFSGEKEKIKNNYILNKYGLDGKIKFDDYFKLVLTIDKGFVIEPKYEGLGIVPVVNDCEHPVLSILDDLIDTATGKELFVKQKNTMTIGFVLAKENNDPEDHHTRSYQLIAIKGKPNKKNDKLVSGIDYYENHLPSDVFYLTENQKQLLGYCNDDVADEFEELRKWKQAFNLLENEKFVFSSFSDGYTMKKKDLEPINLSSKIVDLKFCFADSEAFIELKPLIVLGDKEYPVGKINSSRSDYFLTHVDGQLCVNKTVDVCDILTKLTTNIKMSSAHKALFFERIISPLSKKWNVDFNSSKYFDSDTVVLTPQKRQLFLSEQDKFVIFKPQLAYDHEINCNPFIGANILKFQNNKVTEFVIDTLFEETFLGFIKEMHSDFNEQERDGMFYLSSDKLLQDSWFFGFFEKLKEADIEIFGIKGLKNFRYSPYRAKVTTSIKSGLDWFDVGVQMSFGDISVSLSEIRKAIIKQQKYIKLDDGSLGLLPQEWLEKLNNYFRNSEIRKGVLKVSKLRFSIIDTLFENIDDEDILNELAEKKDKLKQLKGMKFVRIPKGIKAKLRPYQKEGLNWLVFLNEMKWGGILADDMGLGKTLQVLAFINKISTKSKSPSLIVVPTTLLFNWQKEIEKFSPELKAFYYYGPDRKKDISIFPAYDLIFTTYGTLTRDVEVLSSFKFNYVILDESQAIKNPGSQRFKSASLLKANNRIAMTGTPIENSTFDLFAQMSFVNPGLLGTIKSFKDNYSNAIDKDGDKTIASELQKIINPFVLRRTKEQVASELPPKTEDVVYCEMESEQRNIYNAFRNDYREKLLSKIEEDGLAKSKFFVLEGLLKLRQICNSPALLNDEDIDSNDSVKIRELLRFITEKTAGHKVLVFSQFVSMLHLIRAELKNNGIEYEYLDGKCSTKQREASVNNFQTKEKLRVFLISLKAGGTGLNLTAADYVFIVDPWWNPAVEEQAIDRCYRIGQNKNVFAYRMICKNSIEEKIAKLQSRKKLIAGNLIKVDDESIMKNERY